MQEAGLVIQYHSMWTEKLLRVKYDLNQSRAVCSSQDKIIEWFTVSNAEVKCKSLNTAKRRWLKTLKRTVSVE